MNKKAEKKRFLACHMAIELQHLHIGVEKSSMSKTKNKTETCLRSFFSNRHLNRFSVRCASARID